MKNRYKIAQLDACVIFIFTSGALKKDVCLCTRPKFSLTVSGDPSWTDRLLAGLGLARSP